MSERPWLRHYAPGVRATLEYPEVPLHRLVEETATRYPELPAIRFYGWRLRYGELWHQVRAMARALADLGVQPGDRVALMLPNCPQYVIAYYGTLMAGAVVAQVNPLYTERELQYLVTNAGAETIVVADLLYPKVQAVLESTPLRRVVVASLGGSADLGPEARRLEALLAAAPPEPPAVEVRPGDVAVLQYTGGTTGVSKGAMLTHANLVANAIALQEWVKPVALGPGEERVLAILPLFHSYGMTVCMNQALIRGAELILLPRLDLQELMETIRETRPTSFPGVPTLYAAVNQFPDADKYGLDSIRLCNSGAAPLPLEILQAFEARTGAQIVEGYGLSEASPVTHSNPVGGLRKPGSIGIPLPDTDAEIVDVETGTRVLPPGEIGELRVRGPQVMVGYWQMPEETRNALRDGWLYTGDLAWMDEDGYFYIVDRKKDMIIVSGFNVYPREVEEVLYEHPAVAEACVAGVPDPYQGERVKAYVVLKPGHQVTGEELQAYCRQRLAGYKVPREVEFRSSLPKSNVGKVLRRLLVEEERRRGA
ncbi:MAG: long-chain fatty acid--CoA ligase [Bacillota bacterium]|nr:MAG: long-chain fatty acid--CoA ligase [Bacillota bacterium]